MSLKPILYSNTTASGLLAENYNALVPTVDNFAAARAFIGEPGMRLYIAGATTPGDGGQGMFTWVVGNITDDNTDTLVATKAFPTAGWYRLDSVASGISIGLFVNAGSAPIVPGTTVVMTSGYSSVGTGGAKFQYDPAVNAAYVAANPRSSFISAFGFGYRLSTAQLVNVQMFGAIPDDNGTSGTDNLPAFTAAFAWSYAQKLSGGFGFGAGPTISVPSGRYYLNTTSAPLALNHGFLFQGATGGIGNGDPQLRFPTNTNAILVSTTGFGFLIQGFFIYSTAGSCNVLYPGIWAQTKGTIRDTTVGGFSGPGIYWDGTGSNNVNSWRLDDVMTFGSSHSGVLVAGGNGNSGLATGLESDNNARYGIEDNSFLGNIWKIKNISTNTLGAYTLTNPNALSTFEGYTEGDQPAGDLGAHGVALGQQLAGTTGGAGLIANTLDGGGLFSSTGYSYDNASGSQAITQHFGGGIPSQIVSNWGSFESFGFSNDSRATSTNYNVIGSAQGILVGINPFAYLQGTSTVYNLYFQGSNPAKGGNNYGRTNPVPYAININGFWVGEGNAARQVTYGSAAPTSGEYALGDLVLNNAPSAGGTPGWMCTTAGGIATANWAGSTAYGLNALVLNDSGKTYVCITPGTSASSGGPTGTGSSISDGTVTWKYLPSFVFKAMANLAS